MAYTTESNIIVAENSDEPANYQHFSSPSPAGSNCSSLPSPSQPPYPFSGLSGSSTSRYATPSASPAQSKKRKNSAVSDGDTFMKHIQQMDQQIFQSLDKQSMPAPIDEATSFYNSLVLVLQGFSKKKNETGKAGKLFRI